MHIYMRRPDGRLSTYEVKISTNSTRNSFIVSGAESLHLLEQAGVITGASTSPRHLTRTLPPSCRRAAPHGRSVALPPGHGHAGWGPGPAVVGAAAGDGRRASRRRDAATAQGDGGGAGAIVTAACRRVLVVTALMTTYMIYTLM
mgnify:CR=1 FL=1